MAAGRNKTKTNWVPNDSYQLTLKQISEQLTPSGLYRHTLATTGRAERELRRLEWRWERRLEKWTRSATRVKAAYRGMLGRRYFKTIKDDLEMKKKQRVAKVEAIKSFREGDREKTLEILNFVEQMNGELYLVKAKVLYMNDRWEEGLISATNASETKAVELDARFIMANCYVKLNRMDEAFDQLNILSILGDDRIDSRRLRAYVACKLEPPNYDDAILVMDGIVDDYPTDLNMLLHRACIFCCQQNYLAAIEDYSLILTYQANLELVLLLRARAYCCCRKWTKAEEDYELVLKKSPGHPQALQCLEDIRQPILELPMLDDEIVDG